MYIEKIEFPNNIPISCEGIQVGTYHLHMHKDVIEILIVIKGKAKVTVSCELFDMDEGDYLVIRESDSHTYSAADSGCEIVSLHIKMQDYLEQIPYLYYVIFACESFDLAKYRNETVRIRRMIGSIILNLIKGDNDSIREARKGTEHLLWLLVKDYDMIKYYNRKWDAPFSKIEKYYAIMGYIFNYYYMKNIREYISQNEYYSKSYITHLFKEVGASSFKDMLDFVRIFKSEEMLLNSNLSIIDISDRCGFSDVKYYTANFKKWFLCTPSEYRKNSLFEVNKKSICTSLDTSLIVCRINRLISTERENTHYRAAVTPLSVKVFGTPSGNVPCDISGNESRIMVPNDNLSHYIQVPVGADILQMSNSELASYVESYNQEGFTPVLTIDLRKTFVSNFGEVISKCIETFDKEKMERHRIIIIYDDPSMYDEINKQIFYIRKTFQFAGVKSILITCYTKG